MKIITHDLAQFEILEIYPLADVHVGDPRLIIKIFKPKNYKRKITSMAVCQDCGYSWRV